MYNKNRIGPKTDPSGTPDVTEIWNEVSPSSATQCATQQKSLYFPSGFESKMWDLIASVPDHCLSFYFDPIEGG